MNENQWIEQFQRLRKEAESEMEETRELIYKNWQAFDAMVGNLIKEAALLQEQVSRKRFVANVFANSILDRDLLNKIMAKREEKINAIQQS